MNLKVLHLIDDPKYSRKGNDAVYGDNLYEIGLAISSTPSYLTNLEELKLSQIRKTIIDQLTEEIDLIIGNYFICFDDLPKQGEKMSA
jgi:hypothetical protein